jgi:glycosidase
MAKNYREAQAAEAQKFAQREADWRNGSIVYQVLVDRFAPPENLDAKRQHYAPPRRLRDWAEEPGAGSFLPEAQVYSHEVDFWGGDLPGLRSKLPYLTGLGVDVVYLNPINAAFTNHKYDALDYMQVSPEYGSQADLAALIEQVHQAGMKIVLDGVFNHVGRQSELFQQACANPTSPYCGWFTLNEQLPHGARTWANVRNLPELNFENPAVRSYIYEGADSVVRSYLRAGIDGWRLDVAYELGYPILHELTNSAHQEKPGSLVIGEIWNYPKDWSPALDAVMNFTLRQLILDALLGHIAPGVANDMFEKTIQDTGLEETLKSWLVLDNHDTARITAILPQRADQMIAQVLQFTLPGSPNVYYGSELGMHGAGDPSNRAPMRWDLVTPDNEVYRWTQHLLRLRKTQRALKIGDFRKLLAGGLLAFERCTEKVGETLLVIANPSEQPVQETLLVPDSKLMNGTKLFDLLGSEQIFTIFSGTVAISLPPKTALVLQPQTAPVDDYSPYKRFA